MNKEIKNAFDNIGIQTMTILSGTEVKNYKATEEMTTCEVADSAKAFKCQTEEQCDDCFMVDHLKSCSGCPHYDHPEIDIRKQKESFEIKNRGNLD